MADLIDRQALIEWLKKVGRFMKCCENTKRTRETIGGIISHIEKLPTVDAVEVVRCKECEHAREMDKYEKKLYLDECVGCTKLSTSYHSVIRMPDEFCSYGERRADDAD